MYSKDSNLYSQLHILKVINYNFYLESSSKAKLFLSQHLIIASLEYMEEFLKLSALAIIILRSYYAIRLRQSHR
jgi:hypothetical protein